MDIFKAIKNAISDDDFNEAINKIESLRRLLVRPQNSHGSQSLLDVEPN